MGPPIPCKGKGSIQKLQLDVNWMQTVIEITSNNGSLRFFHPLSAELKNLIFHQIEVVSRYRDPQLQVGENYSYLFNLRQKTSKKLMFLNSHFIPTDSGRQNKLQTIIVVLSAQRVNPSPASEV